jgi:hypothetical protein
MSCVVWCYVVVWCMIFIVWCGLGVVMCGVVWCGGHGGFGVV